MESWDAVLINQLTMAILQQQITQPSLFIQSLLKSDYYYCDSGNNIHDLLVYCRKYWPKKTIPPNLHMLEDHAADFIERSSPGHGDGVYGEHGAESIHKIFRLLQRTYCSMQPATIRLQSMLKKNIID